MSDQDIKRHLNEYCKTHDAEDWTKVEDPNIPEDCRIIYRSSGPERTWIRMQCEVPTPYSFHKLVKRPEFVCRYPDLADPMISYELVEHLAPGDCLLGVRFGDTSFDKTASLLLGKGAGAGSHEAQHIRSSHHDDVPHPGQTTCVMVSMGLDPMNFAGAAFSAIFFNFAPGSTVGWTRFWLTYQVAWQTYPTWFTPLGVATIEMCKHKGELYRAEMPRYKELAENFYKVVCLRGCCRGPPLLPQDEWSETTTTEKIGGHYWYAAEEGTFTFSGYLQTLLRLCGSSARVFSTLSGQRLVPYQCAVLSEEWDAVEARFKDLFAAQCSAYRFLRGGSGAPKLKTDVEPRFVPETDHRIEPTKLSIDDFMIFKVENKTFLDFKCAQDNFIDPRLTRKAAEAP